MEINTIKRFRITIMGSNVQRCGFRKEAARLAREMGLQGQAAYVNKDILIEVEGDELILKQFAEWCKTGPEFCNVEQMEESEMEVIGKQGFTTVCGVVNFDISQKSA